MASTRSAIRSAAPLVLLASVATPLSSEAASRRGNGGCEHADCYAGLINGTRTLTCTTTALDSMKVSSCAAFCAQYQYFGLGYGRECYCGDSQVAKPSPGAKACSFPCAGDETGATSCSASSLQDVYINKAYVASVPGQSLDSTVQSPGYVGKHKYQGCYTDSTAQRSLTGKVVHDRL